MVALFFSSLFTLGVIWPKSTAEHVVDVDSVKQFHDGPYKLKCDSSKFVFTFTLFFPWELVIWENILIFDIILIMDEIRKK